MNLDLEPPTVQPLSPSQRARLRHRVAKSVATSRRRRRTWAAPLLAAASVGAVVSAGLIAINGSSEVATTGAPPGTTGSPRGTTATLDRGTPTAADLAAALKRCQPDGTKRTDVVWSREVAGPAPNGDAVVLLVKTTPGQQGGTYGLGLRACFSHGVSGSVRDQVWVTRPTAAQGLVTLSGVGAIRSAGRGEPAVAQYESLHRVRPEIVRIESRYVWPAGHGPWSRGVVAGGLAYTASSATIPAGQYKSGNGASGVREELRAFDALGRPVSLGK
jgi:hypothetical protein